jgi:hypothetical protein
MNAILGISSGLAGLIRKALEGRVSPLNFLLLLGFFSTLVLMYISLHVYFFSLSNEVASCRERLEYQMDLNARLTAEYNRLVSPARIIPLAVDLGLRAGSYDEVERFAIREDAGSQENAWASAPAGGIGDVSRGIDPRGR